MKKKVSLICCLIIGSLLVGCTEPQPKEVEQTETFNVKQVENMESVKADESKADSVVDSKVVKENDPEDSSTNTSEQGTGDSTETETAEDTGEIHVIKERMFIAQVDDIYLNPEVYKNKRIQVEGFYDQFEAKDESRTFRYVMRKSPGCCGNDGMIGFQLEWEGEGLELNDWIKVIGAVHYKVEEDYMYPVIEVESIEVLEERGQEFVKN